MSPTEQLVENIPGIFWPPPLDIWSTPRLQRLVVIALTLTAENITKVWDGLTTQDGEISEFCGDIGPSTLQLAPSLCGSSENNRDKFCIHKKFVINTKHYGCVFRNEKIILFDAAEHATETTAPQTRSVAVMSHTIVLSF